MSSNSSSSSIELNAYSMYCIIAGETTLIYVAFFITNLLFLLPLCIVVLFLGIQRQRSSSSAVMASPSDVFTYHMTAMELVGISGYILCCVSIYIYDNDDMYVLMTGNSLWCFTWYGEMFFHVLTCLERYLAVVHPVTYRSLRGEQGVRIRNISTLCVWLLSTGGMGLMYVTNVFTAVCFSTLILCMIIVSFCSLSVLCILINPRPGEHGGDSEWGDQSKRRAFHTILSILIVLLLRFFLNIVLEAFFAMKKIVCLLTIIGLWFNIPSSVLLPMMFLKRARALACCKKNTISG